MNPKFDFYTKLLSFVNTKEIFPENLADAIVELYDTNKKDLSFVVDMEFLREFHGELDANACRDVEIMEEIVESLFEDLASQMRSESVRLLLESWQSRCGLGNDLFIHLRRVKSLGDGVASVTMLTSNIAYLREFHEDPDEFIRMHGHVHVSESEASKDPN